ncbi:RNA-directed DNA polymerase, eukaryota [Tanacetum coccineum]
MNLNNDMSNFYDYYSKGDMKRYAQYFEYFKQYETLENKEGESSIRNSEKHTRRYIPCEREVAKEKLRRDYFGDENNPPIHPEEYFQRMYCFSPIMKCTSVIRQLAYGSSPDAFDEYLQVAERCSRECLWNFTKCIYVLYVEEFLRKPTLDDVQHVYELHERKHGLPRMLKSIDCMHWEWTKCPKSLHDFRVPGENNDLNVLYGSSLFDDLLADKAPEVLFVVNGKTYEKGYYLADEIYPQWSTFVKSFTMAKDEKTMKFKRVQESSRKDIERAFGVGQFKLHTNKARFQRATLNKGQGADHKKSVDHDSPAIVLDEDCALSKDLSSSLMGRIKEFASLTNLKNALINEGFVDLNVSYLGELWVLLEFSSVKSKEAFRDNVGVSSWFSEIRQASFDINPDGRIVWVEIEGVPLKLWTLNTFKRIVTRWGNLIDTNDSDGNCFHSKRLCLFTKSISNIYENFKIIFRGKVYWIRAKEVPGWTPDLVEDSDEEELSDDDSLEEGMKNLESENDCSNSFEVPDTVFENEGGSKKDSSVDPFGLYPLLNKKTKDQKHKESGTNSSPKFPPGFTPNNDNDDTGDKKSVNDFEEEKLNEDDGDSNNSNLKENVDESASFGRFKKSVAPSSGGSFMCLMEEVVKVGQTMGYNMDGVINNLSDIIESQGASINKVNFLAIQETKMEEIDLFSVRRGVWLLNGIDLMIIAVYAPHDPRDKRMLWDYLAHVINQWQGEVVIMGDFNEVRVKSDRFGTNFNVLGANIFNSFINSTGLEEVHLGGSAFTWCHKSATKMSKLDRFFVSNNLLNIFPHISGITLDRFLSDHRPILLRESAHDYGPVPFRFFHHWIHLEGFNDFVTSTWNSAPSVDSNGMRNLAGKLKFLKAHIKIWIKDNKSETVSTIANLKKELNQLDAVIDKGTGTEVEAEKRMEVLAALRNIDHIHSMDLAQKAKIKWSIEGDENSNFFHGILNKKRNQMNIRGITIDGVWKEQPNDVKQEFLSHFQDRFAKPSERRANIDMRFPKTISEDQSQDLEREVSKQEIKTAVWGCGTDKSPGPDGFSFGFYRHFWPVIEHDVYMAVNHFFIHGEIPPGCNSSFIALIPKVPDANLVKDFRPISLIGSIYKIIAKILSNRLVNVLGDIVNEVQSAFIAERQMLDGEWSDGNISTLIHVLKCFFHASGLKINLNKSKIMGINVESAQVIQAAAKLGCLVLKCPFYYLGIEWKGVLWDSFKHGKR